jgi:small subunit ribosomal protein S8
MTDPIADFLPRIRNGILARKATVDCPASKIKLKVAELLVAEGFISGVTESAADVGTTLTVTLRWDAQRRPAITTIRRVSKPGQRHYVPATAIPKVRGGMGTSLISTSKGLMTDRDARKQNVGGEVICEVW